MTSLVIAEVPVTLAPGRARLATSPAPTGSATLTITIGTVLVAFLAASDACVTTETKLAQPALKFIVVGQRPGRGRAGRQVSNLRDLPDLLRVRSERPRGGRAAEQRDELAAIARQILPAAAFPRFPTRKLLVDMPRRLDVPSAIFRSYVISSHSAGSMLCAPIPHLLRSDSLIRTHD